MRENTSKETTNHLDGFTKRNQRQSKPNQKGDA